jgi:peptide methionine sulfoxide reductase msrA/msrB
MLSRKKILFTLLLTAMTIVPAESQKPWTTKLNDLTAFEKHVIVEKGTERAFSGKYVNTKEKGVYKCKVCDTALYRSDDKFDSHCGWPSFDDAIPGAVKEIADKDGKRTEIVCANCGAHLGHVFKGERLTKKNVRHCVNSVSLQLDKKKAVSPHLKKAYFAGGCFWGVEYYLEKINGVKEVISGFMGGNMANPSYKDVIYKNTGHLETVEVLYDPIKVSYETLAKIFFEIHDPTQINGQGPDIGKQYLSAVFVNNKEERDVANRLINILENKGLKVATKVLNVTDFYTAEEYHQDHYERKGGTPYCHTRVKRFD